MKLTKKARSKIPTSKFAGPGRSFPVEDKKHARAALMLIGKAPASARGRIRSMARNVLGKG